VPLRQIIYYQYVVKRGLHAPWTVKMKNAVDQIGGEGKIPPLLLNKVPRLTSFGGSLWGKRSPGMG
jgi:hypothetical protein